MPVPLLMDVDTGVDDAVALALATTLTRHELVAVTTVAGNVPVENSTDNTLRVLDWLGCSVPVYRGMSAPLVRPLWTAREHHGPTGLGNWAAPASTRSYEDRTAPEAIIQLASQHRGEITFVFVGPLTNLAVALSLEPRIAGWVSCLVVMGGAFFERGNVTEHAEFNVFVDPEAASAVARAGMATTWVGLDATRQALLTRERWAGVGTSTDARSSLVREVMRRSFEELQRPAFPLHDPLAVAVAEDPEVVTTRGGAVRVDMSEGYRGETRLADAASHDSRARVAHTVDAERFSGLFERICPR